ncbi:hypothetical protein Rumeso_01187 [Rubellimicrobium mesophilum DSM 19309]|uniref:SH3b domain-containing protein n=1 Tax=Rubellimicrobium mesophilum DSM 19309 TaxID=442562 RepID=A0A017HSC8_9RHOB|nr:SH3 domain-containing protein [Rubellimicrobium mesophilum]EYD77240.1 hypothetical protein Rumeso_01187 [Rubellimicrobium mesophilum DSM 19309]
MARASAGPQRRGRALPHLALFILGLAGPTLIAASPSWAQTLDVPVVVMEDDGQAAVCATSTVSGLDPNGDNLLAVRSGPGTAYPKIDELHTGGVAFTCDGQGNWVGIYYPDLNGRSGWMHGRYLTRLAGCLRSPREAPRPAPIGRHHRLGPCPSPSAVLAQASCQDIRFAPGASSATLTGEAVTEAPLCFSIEVGEGQRAEAAVEGLNPVVMVA